MYMSIPRLSRYSTLPWWCILIYLDWVDTNTALVMYIDIPSLSRYSTLTLWCICLLPSLSRYSTLTLWCVYLWLHWVYAQHWLCAHFLHLTHLETAWCCDPHVIIVSLTYANVLKLFSLCNLLKNIWVNKRNSEFWVQSSFHIIHILMVTVVYCYPYTYNCIAV